MAVNFKMAKVVSHENPASTFHDIVFETDEYLEFEPGQYLTCKVAEDRLNSYSIAGRLEGNKFGFMVDSKPGGPGSQYFAGLKPGDEMPFLGPFGKFVLKTGDGSEHLLMMGTGSGLAPLKCMVEAALREHKMATPITLYFGLRFEEDLLWQEYLHGLEEEYSNFKLVMCLSKPGENWQGKKGHITDLLREDFSDLSRASMYLCGGQKMIEEAVGIAKEKGMAEERIYHEKFF